VGYSAGAWGIWYLLQEPKPVFCSAILFASLPIMNAVERIEENFPNCMALLETRLDEWSEALADRSLYLIQSRDDELFPYAGAERAYTLLQERRSNITFRTIQGVGHFEGEGYIEPLQAAIPWLLKTWKTPGECAS
jgi:predicted esterase